MTLGIKKMFCIVADGKVVSDNGWEKVDKMDDYIIVSRSEKQGELTLACYSIYCEEPVFVVENVHSYDVDYNGIIVGRRNYYDHNEYYLTYGFYDFAGNITIPFEYDIIKKCDNHSEFLFVIQFGSGTGICHYSGEIVVPASYYHFKQYNRCMVFENDSNEENEKRFGIFFLETRKFFEPQFEEVELKGDICIFATDNEGKYGAFSFDGNCIIPFEFDALIPYFLKHDTYGVVCYKGVDCNLLTGMYLVPSGKCMIPLSQSSIEIADYGVNVIDANDETIEVYSFDGFKILPNKYDRVEYIGDDKLLTRLKDIYSIYGTNGSIIHSGSYKYVICEQHKFIKYFKVVPHNSDNTFLYIPCINTFVKGDKIKFTQTGQFAYYSNEDWNTIPKSIYNNANTIFDLNRLEEATL